MGAEWKTGGELTEACEVITFEKGFSVVDPTGEVANAQTGEGVYAVDIPTKVKRSRLGHDERWVILDQELCQGVGLGAAVP